MLVYIIIGIFALLFFTLEIVGLVKDIKRRKALKKSIPSEQNINSSVESENNNEV